MRGARLPTGARTRVVSDEQRVYLRAPARSDQAEFIALMRASRSFHRPWASAPTDDERFAAYLADAAASRLRGDAPVPTARTTRSSASSTSPRSLAARFRAPTSATRSASRYARHGYMREGIELVLRRAFLKLRLHRIEANIQPGNRASIALARGAGFRREGFSPRYLKIGGRWRDHERWAILAEEWRARRRARPPAAERVQARGRGADRLTPPTPT